ncbi:MAG: tetratricopeptide repeat protein [Candidatus Aminicenantes bacterium]|jgi:TPR repeat protein
MTVENKDPFKMAYDEMMKDNPNEELAFSLFEQAHESGDPRATYAIATWYFVGDYVKKDINKAVVLLKQSAKKKVPDAMYGLAISYEKGVGVKKGKKRAFDLYLKAALRNHHQSVEEVARCYWFGIGINSNKRVSRIWYERAKELGVSEENDPINKSSLIEVEGKQKEFELYLKEALRNKHQAFEKVARCYYLGIGVKSNRRVARIWYERAKELSYGVEIPFMKVP